MSNPSLAELRSPSSRNVYTFPDHDDDDDAADDDDEEEGIAVARNERWFTGSGFGSPEWWSQH